MANRDGEPEYIDDDEYFDPDDPGGNERRGGSRLGRPMALGGSGTRSSRGDHQQHSGAGRERDPKRRAPAGNRDARERPGKIAKPAASGRESDKSSNGKRERDLQPAERESRGQSADGKSNRGGRFFNLRARMRRDGEGGDSDAARPGRRPWVAIRGGIGKLRDRFRDDQAPNQPARPDRADGRHKPQKTDAGGSSIRAAFGATRGETRRSASDRRQNAPTSSRPEGRNDRSQPEAPGKTPVLRKEPWLDLDRKLDLIGVALVFGAIVLFFSALSREQAAISALNNLIGQLLGWGAMAVPIAMLAGGLWLIIRHFGERAPTVDPLRLAGAGIAFLGVLILFQFIESFSYSEFIASVGSCGEDCMRILAQNSYQSGRGGGYVGAWFYLALVSSLTEVGGFFVVLMALTFAAMLTTRMTMAEIAVIAIGCASGIRSGLARQAARRRARRLQAQEQLSLAHEEADLRVSRPAAAKLPGRLRSAPALPKPSGVVMPLTLRLRDTFMRRVWQPAHAKAEIDAASAAAEPETDRPGIFGRLFNLGERPDANPAATANANAASGRPLRNWTRPERPEYGPSKTRSQPIPRWQPPAPDDPVAAPAQSYADIAPAVERDRELDFSEKVDPAQPISAADNQPEKPEEANVTSPASEKITPAKAAARDGDLPDEALIPAQPDRSDVSTPISSQPKQPRPDWQLPDLQALLSGGSTGEMDEGVLLEHAQIIEDTLSSFGAPGRVVELNSGPVITQFGVEPDYLTARSGKRSRVKVSAIAQLDKDLQLALGAKSIRVEAPVPGKGYVGIEVPNPDSAMVSLRDVMESEGFLRISSPLAIALGKSVAGSPVAADLTQMPHLLIAGTTGSGKSKCINAIIISILANCTPNDVKFIMVDPKRVELTGYNGLPHLVAPVVVELERIVGVLRWVMREMDQRYKTFSQAGARHIVDYNDILGGTDPMPYIVVIVDELADLMMMAPDETERSISRIAALARATGIHLVIATQRPSVDVVTGLIKANFPARIAFAVAGSVDSRVILDQPGAERLLGKGDMLYLSGDAPAPLRMQGVFVSDDEINNLTRFWKLQNMGVDAIAPISLPALPARKANDRAGDSAASSGTGQPGQPAFWNMPAEGAGNGMAQASGHEAQEDELYDKAVEMVRRLEKASISLLQRRLRIGYTRAARLIDVMEERGVVGPPKEGSSKPRDVLPRK